MMHSRTFAAALAAVTTGALGYLAAPKPEPAPPYTPAREVVTKTVTIPADNQTWTDATVDCPAGKVVVSGGWDVQPEIPSAQDPRFLPHAMRSYPADADTWAFTFSPYGYTVYNGGPWLILSAVCVNGG